MSTSVFLFVAGAAFLIYGIAGYPALLWLIARRAVRETEPVLEPRTVTVLLPVHNGGKWLAQKLRSILEQDYPRSLVDIIVISDGSTDDTDAIADSFAGSGVRLVRVTKGGKARALNKGLEVASGEVLFCTDVRQPLDRACLRSLVARFADPEVGAVCGELIILDGDTDEELSIGLYWKLEKWIRRQLSASGSLLVVTGCLYAVRRGLAQPVPDDALGDDIFMPQNVLRQGATVVFEPRARAYDYPTDLRIEFHRKVRTLAGLYQYVLRRGLGVHPFHFFSYKVSRLLLPWALLTVAGATVFLPQPWLWIAALPQMLFYSLAVLDPRIPPSVLKRISSPARTFCSLMVAAVIAARIMFVPPEKMWKPSEIRPPGAPVS